MRGRGNSRRTTLSVASQDSIPEYRRGEYPFSRAYEHENDYRYQGSAEAFDSESHTDRVARLRKQIEDSQEELENIRYCNHEEWVSISNNIGGLDNNSFSLTIECKNCGSHGVAEWEEPTFVSWDRTYMSEEEE